MSIHEGVLLLYCMYTVNLEMFTLYIFPPNSRFINIRENIYTVKITFIKAYRAGEF